MSKKSKEYSKSMILLLIALAVTAFFAFLIAAPWVLWILKQPKELDIRVVDKTVPYPDFREHAGLFWLLKNEKIVKPGSRVLYDERSDYYGFYPLGKDPNTGKDSWRVVSLPQDGRKPDLIYLADTYGVYQDDYLQRRLPGDFSPLIYGGLTEEDYRIIQEYLGNGNILVGEFNTAASPTNERDRLLFGRLIGLKWRGWIGNYYENLAKEGGVPLWIVRNWEAKTRQSWDFSGRGIILLEDNGAIEVFTEAEDIGPEWLKIIVDEPLAKELRIRKPISYRYWFEWVVPDSLVKQVAHFRWDLTKKGREKLARLGLPDVFPAILNYETPQYTSWYFAGDFADLQFKGTPYRMEWIRQIKRFLADDTVDNNSYFFWKVYAPLMHKIISEAYARRIRVRAETKPSSLQVNVHAAKDGFELKSADGVWKKLVVRGVNLGSAEPGKFFTQFPYETETYMRWLSEIAYLGANTVRVYTLLPPEFYRALRIYNTSHPDAPILLLQEIWPEEHPPGDDYLQASYQEEFEKEISFVVDAIYGRANVPQRKGRAWGVYTSDVSPWLLGWLVGRELESAEVLRTDANHKSITYKGEYVSAGASASPTEVWLAMCLDEVAKAEAERYGRLHPSAIVSWPTLDPIEHDTEWDPATGKKNRWNDRASIAIEHLDVTEKMTAGIFGAYHIYPNYPDFIVNEPKYSSYRDEFGLLRYGGYLREFIQTHKRYPAIVAEFGMANGAGVAHLSPDGLHHGGIPEEEAGHQIMRMFRAILREGYAGAVIFEFMDEWAKKTWITEPFKIPFERRVLWHDVVDPENNYGLVANEAIPPDRAEAELEGSGVLERLEVAHDASYLYLSLSFKEGISPKDHRVMLGIDTYRRDYGQMRWPGTYGGTASGLEFLLDFSGKSLDLLVNPTYNITRARYASRERRDGVFEPLMMLVNGKVTTKSGEIIPERYFNASNFREGPFDESGNLWNVRGSTLHIRVPWGRLNVTDPSSFKVLDDPRTNIGSPGVDMLKITITDGFVFDGLAVDPNKSIIAGRLKPNTTAPYRWNGWEETPPYRERRKKSYDIVRRAWAPESEADRSIRAAFVRAKSSP